MVLWLNTIYIMEKLMYCFYINIRFENEISLPLNNIWFKRMIENNVYDYENNFTKEKVWLIVLLLCVFNLYYFFKLF